MFSARAAAASAGQAQGFNAEDRVIARTFRGRGFFHGFGKLTPDSLLFHATLSILHFNLGSDAETCFGNGGCVTITPFVTATCKSMSVLITLRLVPLWGAPGFTVRLNSGLNDLIHSFCLLKIISISKAIPA